MTIKEENRENHEIDNVDVLRIVTNTAISPNEAIQDAIKILNKRFDETLNNLSNLSLYKELDHDY